MKKTLLLFSAALLWSAAAFAQDEAGSDEIIFAPAQTEINTTPGGTFNVEFNLTNKVQCTAFQWYMGASEYFTPVVDEITFGEDNCRLTKSYIDMSDITASGMLGIVYFYNPKATSIPMPLGEGLFCTIPYTVGEDVEAGEYELEVIDAIFSWSVIGDGSSDVLGAEIPNTTIKVKVGEAGVNDLLINDEYNNGENAIYDLTGRRVQNPSNGIYIVNGKKVVVK